VKYQKNIFDTSIRFWSCIHDNLVSTLCFLLAKWYSLKLKTWQAQLLGFLPLDIALLAANQLGVQKTVSLVAVHQTGEQKSCTVANLEMLYRYLSIPLIE